MSLRVKIPIKQKKKKQQQAAKPQKPKPPLSRRAFDDLLASLVVSHRELSLKTTLNELAKVAGITPKKAAELWKEAKDAAYEEGMPVA